MSVQTTYDAPSALKLGVFNNLEPHVVVSKALQQDTNVGAGVNRDGTIGLSVTGELYGIAISTLKENSHPYSDAESLKLKAKSVSGLLREGTIAVTVITAVSAGDPAGVSATGTFGAVDTTYFAASNVTFDTSGEAGQLVNVRLNKANL